MYIKYTKEQLELAVQTSTSMSGVLRALGRCGYSGHMARHVKKRLLEYGIDSSHFTGRSHNKGVSKIRKYANEILIPGKTRRTATRLLRRSLLELGVVYECKECGLPPEWKGKPLVLQIDHINGDWSDDRFENLRFLCPPCHTQQPTYGNKRKEPLPPCEPVVSECCGATFRSQKTLDRHKCRGRRLTERPQKDPFTWPEKADWPPAHELQELVWAQPVQRLAVILGVSEVAVKKRCDRLGIATPSRGYWVQLKVNEQAWPTDEDLSKLIWTAPLRKIAEPLGVTADALRARCKKRGIPAPPKGYWNSSRVKK